MRLYDKLHQHKNVFRQAPSISANSAALTASFVIPVFNSQDSILHSVASIASQERADLINEVVLVNDGSTDDSLQVIRRLQEDFPRLNIVCVDNGTRRYAAFARNRGVEKSTGDLICFIDSDIVLPKDYMVRHMSQHQAEECITFSLRSHVARIHDLCFPILLPEGDFRHKLLNNLDGGLQGAPFQFSDTHTLAELCLTCAATYRRKDLINVKGCPENFVGWGFNDTALAAKIISLGRPVVHVADSVVGHLEHAPRSGRTAKKWAEFAQNKKRYMKMLELTPSRAFAYNIDVLEL
jgi:glycosyltransferase involved in cell wall biosynthesis